MKLLLLAVLVLAACATGARTDLPDAEVVLIEGFSAAEVREAARSAVQSVAHSRSVVRVTDDGVTTEGRIGACGEDVACGESTRHPGTGVATPWTTIQVRLDERNGDTAVEIEVEYESRAHCTERWLEPSCSAERLGSNRGLERRIAAAIRAHLAGQRIATPGA